LSWLLWTKNATVLWRDSNSCLSTGGKG
jgi:hypothetical protein